MDGVNRGYYGCFQKRELEYRNYQGIGYYCGRSYPYMSEWNDTGICPSVYKFWGRNVFIS